ncbi:MAG: vitamin K epoxide reductase family protein [Actinomycetes bacterium]
MENNLPAKLGLPRPLVVFGTFTLSIFGLGISIYLTVAHYISTTLLACPETGTINCAKVTSSAQSSLLGIPVAVLGLVFFVAMVVLNSPPAWYVAPRRLHQIRFFAALTGIVFVLWLITAELLIIGAICLWCTAVHIVTFALVILIVNETPRILGWGTQPEA